MPNCNAPLPLSVVSIQTSSEQGGGEYANVDMLDGLAGRGAAVWLLTNQPRLVAGTRVRARQIHLGPKLSRASVPRVAAIFPVALLRLARALAKQQATRAPDVVLVSYKKEQLLVALLPAFLTRAVVWTEWGPVPRQFRRGLARRCYLLAARRARRIIAVSETTRRSLIDVGIEAHKIAVVENLVDPEQIRFRQDARKAYRDAWQLKEEDFVVGCITRFHHKKRNDVIVDALARMDMRAVLVLAGDGDDEARLRQRAQPLGNRVRFLPTPRGCVAEFLSACDVQVVAPSNSEGAPRSVVIGQLTARPVIAVSAEGVSDMIEPGTGAIVSPPNDAAALARCLSDYRGDVRRRLQEGRAGRAYAKTRYEPDGVLTRFEDLLYEARQP